MAVSKGNRFRLGFIINPFAGLGGAVALKGSDDMAATALALGAIPMASQRAEYALQELMPLRDQLVMSRHALARSQLYATHRSPQTSISNLGRLQSVVFFFSYCPSDFVYCYFVLFVSNCLSLFTSFFSPSPS